MGGHYKNGDVKPTRVKLFAEEIGKDDQNLWVNLFQTLFENKYTVDKVVGIIFASLTL